MIGLGVGSLAGCSSTGNSDGSADMAVASSGDMAEAKDAAPPDMLDIKVERGRYLMNNVGLCTFCHTPLNPDGTRDMTRLLAGWDCFVDIEPADPNVGCLSSRNLTNHETGLKNATDEQIMEAAKATYVDRFVHSLPDGYDTVLDDEGTTVSAGEKQLITIARAFLAEPTILILDEATSSVDTRTEVQVQVAMNRLRANRTSFVIAHRLSTIRGADIILVMENGQIVEQGSHTELLSHDGPYFRLYNSQFAGAVAEVDA